MAPNEPLAIVMAAGRGERMRPLTDYWPKPLLPIDGRPVLGTLLRELAAAGLDDVVVVTGHLAEQVEAFVGDGSAFGVRARFVRQPHPDGSADVVLRALAEGATLPALVTGADTVFPPGTIARFVAGWGDADAALAPPLWGLGRTVEQHLEPPYGLAEAVKRTGDAGGEVRTIAVEGTRDLTGPLDLIRNNFPYLP